MCGMRCVSMCARTQQQCDCEGSDQEMTPLRTRITISIAVHQHDALVSLVPASPLPISAEQRRAHLLIPIAPQRPPPGMAANCLPLCQLLRQAAGATSPRQLHSAYLASPYPALFAYHRIRRRCHLLPTHSQQQPQPATVLPTVPYSLHQATVQCSLGCRRTGTPS